jgi:hypothetical protein
MALGQTAVQDLPAAASGLLVQMVTVMVGDRRSASGRDNDHRRATAVVLLTAGRWFFVNDCHVCQALPEYAAPMPWLAFFRQSLSDSHPIPRPA